MALQDIPGLTDCSFRFRYQLPPGLGWVDGLRLVVETKGDTNRDMETDFFEKMKILGW